METSRETICESSSQAMPLSASRVGLQTLSMSRRRFEGCPLAVSLGWRMICTAIGVSDGEAQDILAIHPACFFQARVAGVWKTRPLENLQERLVDGG